MAESKAKDKETKGSVASRVPGLDFFKRSDDAPSDPYKIVFIARAMEQALLARDLAAFGRCAQEYPGCLFATFGETQPSQSAWGSARAAWDTLESMPESFAFEAGKAWGEAAAKSNSEAAMKSARETAQRCLDSTLSSRGATIAFACGIAAAPGQSDYAAWLRQIGKTADWARKEFGAAELSIWGKAWGAKAARDNVEAGWCATVLVQAALRGAQGREDEMTAMASAALSLKGPQKGWIKRALDEGEVRFENESRALSRASHGGFFVSEGPELGKPFLAAKLRLVESLCAKLCALGPESWAKAGMSGLSGPEASRVEQELLGNVSKEWAKGAQAPAKRL